MALEDISIQLDQVTPLEAGGHSSFDAHIGKIVHGLDFDIETILAEVFRMGLAAVALLGLVEGATECLGKGGGR
jgi:hypothetical protein